MGFDKMRQRLYTISTSLLKSYVHMFSSFKYRYMNVKKEKGLRYFLKISSVFFICSHIFPLQWKFFFISIFPLLSVNLVL